MASGAIFGVFMATIGVCSVVGQHASGALAGGPVRSVGRVPALRGDRRGLPPCYFHCGEAEALRAQMGRRVEGELPFASD